LSQGEKSTNFQSAGVFHGITFKGLEKTPWFPMGLVG